MLCVHTREIVALKYDSVDCNCNIIQLRLGLSSTLGTTELSMLTTVPDVPRRVRTNDISIARRPPNQLSYPNPTKNSESFVINILPYFLQSAIPM